MSLSFYTHGSGPVRVLCAHSWVASGVTYAPMLPFLDSEKLTWVFPDFHGYGMSSFGEEASIAAMGRDLVAVADQLGWETFHLVGHSMGGQAVQAVLADDQSRSRILTASLISSVPSEGFPLDAESENLFLSAASSKATMQGVVSTLAGGKRSEGFSQYVAALTQATADEATLRSYLRAWTADDVSKNIGEYTGPVLVASGEIDPVLGPPVAGRIAAQFSHSEHVILPGTGHFPPLESPALVAEAVARHILSARVLTKTHSN
ncbi:alpha/beta fold hydrolase [Arthrobacter sp. ISL-69]|uniref:alpha/beta fold hydrolase n=1 Tax=Arthrobacter sp. ISL-69 TaxID=2819113 RepID=UPI001BECB4E8|nr:alpha/beta hydrolase [Arthrobacter sp. ISL-69]MBT2539022.1 alpha/beta hydrolase [Arthrobacter sp. ISL-69]